MLLSVGQQTVVNKQAIGTAIHIVLCEWQCQWPCLCLEDTSQDICLRSSEVGCISLTLQPCKLFMKMEDIHYMFGEMVQRCEQLFFSSLGERSTDDRLLHLPALMEALASIVKEMDMVSIYSPILNNLICTLVIPEVRTPH